MSQIASGPVLCAMAVHAHTVVETKMGLKEQYMLKTQINNKCMLIAGAAIIGHTGKLDACVATPLAHAEAATHNFFMDHRHSALSSQQRTPCRVLYMGLGGGSLPNFLSHHFPGMLIDAVELDPVVMAAATECMGLPNSR